MNPIQTTKMTNFRWVICALLFCATTVNYLDRQVLSLTWKDFIAPEFHWNDAHYGMITGFFSVFYAVACLFAGKFVDWMGIKKGYLWAIFIWSLGACLHAGCGWVTMEVEGLDSVEALRAVEAGSAVAVAIATLSVWLFLVCRAILALGEAGNFPAAIKVTAEYFPKKDRAFATSIFNSGASVGALAAPLTIPILAKHFGWEMAFIIIGAIGFIWMFFWAHLYEKPENSKHVNKAELIYVNQDEEEETKPAEEAKPEKTIPFMQCFKYKQTWSFVVGKFFTDGVWWFYLFWAPAYFSDQFGYESSSTMGMALIFVLYLIEIRRLPAQALCREEGYGPVCRPHACHADIRFLPPLRAVCPAVGCQLGVVPGHYHRSCRSRSPGLVGQPVLDNRRHVPEVDHCNHHRHRRHGRRHRLVAYQPGCRRAVQVFRRHGFGLLVHGL